MHLNLMILRFITIIHVWQSIGWSLFSSPVCCHFQNHNTKKFHPGQERGVIGAYQAKEEIRLQAEVHRKSLVLL